MAATVIANARQFRTSKLRFPRLARRNWSSYEMHKRRRNCHQNKQQGIKSTFPCFATPSIA